MTEKQGDNLGIPDFILEEYGMPENTDEADVENEGGEKRPEADSPRHSKESDSDEDLDDSDEYDDEDESDPFGIKREMEKSKQTQKTGIEKLFRSSREVMEEAFENIRKYQSGEFIPAKTGYSYMDAALLGGIRPQHAIAIGARPSIGKSYVAQKIIENVMDPFLNPQANDYFLVNCEFEMNPQDLLIRRMSREMHKRATDLLKEQQVSEVEIKQMRRVVSKEIRDNIVYIETPCTPQEMEKAIDYICSKEKHRRLVIFKIDHIALLRRASSFGDPKTVIDEMVAVMNDAKLRYKNIFFLVISQFNREIEGRMKSKIEQAPRLSDFYQSDSLGQLCTLMVGLNNPRRYGLQEYMSFSKSWYITLERFKTPSGSSFKTEGLLFHHVLKTRLIGLEDLTETIYPEVLYGRGHLYGEGGVKYVNPNQPPEPPRSYEADIKTIEEEDNGGAEYIPDDCNPF